MTRVTVQRDALAASCVVSLVLAFGFAAAGHAGTGSAIALGLVLGSINGFMFRALLERRAPLLVTSIIRLAALSAAAVGIALLLGWAIWAVVAGVGAAQLLLSGVAARQGLRQ